MVAQHPVLAILSLLLLLCSTSSAFAAAAHTPNCRPGRFYSSRHRRCIACRPGHFSWGGNFKSCLPCPSNTFTPYHGVVDIALCLPCPSTTTSSPGSSFCSSNNKYARSSSSSSAAQSLRSSPAMVCRGKRSAFWISPPEGVSYLPTHVCVSPVTGCPKGTKLKVWARRAVCMYKGSGKVRCGADAVFDGVDRCVSCAEGNYLTRGSGSRKWRCSLCAAGSVSKGGVTRECQKCGCGYAKSLDGTTCVRTIPAGVTIKC